MSSSEQRYLRIGVVGQSGVGRSTLINTLRNLSNKTVIIEDIRVNTAETDRVVFVDIPMMQRTLQNYWEEMDFDSLDIVILVKDEKYFHINELDIINMLKGYRNKVFCIFRNKVDLDENFVQLQNGHDTNIFERYAETDTVMKFFGSALPTRTVETWNELQHFTSLTSFKKQLIQNEVTKLTFGAGILAVLPLLSEIFTPTCFERFEDTVRTKLGFEYDTSLSTESDNDSEDEDEDGLSGINQTFFKAATHEIKSVRTCIREMVRDEFVGMIWDWLLGEAIMSSFGFVSALCSTYTHGKGYVDKCYQQRLFELSQNLYISFSNLCHIGPLTIMSEEKNGKCLQALPSSKSRKVTFNDFDNGNDTSYWIFENIFEETKTYRLYNFNGKERQKKESKKRYLVANPGLTKFSVIKQISDATPFRVHFSKINGFNLLHVSSNLYATINQQMLGERNEAFDNGASDSCLHHPVALMSKKRTGKFLQTSALSRNVRFNKFNESNDKCYCWQFEKIDETTKAYRLCHRNGKETKNKWYFVANPDFTKFSVTKYRRYATSFMVDVSSKNEFHLRPTATIKNRFKLAKKF